jgi:hypothetical protein
VGKRCRSFHVGQCQALGFFVQDDFKVSRRLVVNLGMRYRLCRELETEKAFLSPRPDHIRAIHGSFS